MTIQTNWNGPSGPIPPDYIYRTAPEPFFIAPNAVEASNVFEVPAAGSLVGYALRPMGTAPMIFIWGRADYHDVFGERHFIEWCYQLRLERHRGKDQRITASLIQWGDYNRTD